MTLSQELNNGLTAAASFTMNIADNDDRRATSDVDNDFVLALTAEGTGGLFLGDTAFAAESHWDPARRLQADDFSEQDDEVVLRGDVAFFGVEASTSRASWRRRQRPSERRPRPDSRSAPRSHRRPLHHVDVGYQEESKSSTAGYDAGSTSGVYDPFNNDDFDGDGSVRRSRPARPSAAPTCSSAYARNLTLRRRLAAASKSPTPSGR